MNPSVMQLQREAAARVQKMEEQSRRLVREHPVKIYRGTTVMPACETLPKCEGETVCAPLVSKKPEPCAPQKSHDNGLVSWLAGDEERALLLLLAVVLWNNGAPLELLLALLYVAL